MTIDRAGAEAFTGVASQSTADASGGNVRLDARTLTVINQGSVFTSADGAGRGGDIAVNASERVDVLDGGSVRARTSGPGDGTG